MAREIESDALLQRAKSLLMSMTARDPMQQTWCPFSSWDGLKSYTNLGPHGLLQNSKQKTESAAWSSPESLEPGMIGALDPLPSNPSEIKKLQVKLRNLVLGRTHSVHETEFPSNQDRARIGVATREDIFSSTGALRVAARSSLTSPHSESTLWGCLQRNYDYAMNSIIEENLEGINRYYALHAYERLLMPSKDENLFRENLEVTTMSTYNPPTQTPGTYRKSVTRDVRNDFEGSRSYSSAYHRSAGRLNTQRGSEASNSSFLLAAHSPVVGFPSFKARAFPRTWVSVSTLERATLEALAQSSIELHSSHSSHSMFSVPKPELQETFSMIKEGSLSTIPQDVISNSQPNIRNSSATSQNPQVAARIKKDCDEIWEILFRLGGTGYSKIDESSLFNSSSLSSLRSICQNSLSLLEERCAERMREIVEIGVAQKRSFVTSDRRNTTGAPPGLSYAFIREFSNSNNQWDESTDAPEAKEAFRWQAAYWAFRSGSLKALELLSEEESNSADDIYSLVCRLLCSRLRNTTSSLTSKWQNPTRRDDVQLPNIRAEFDDGIKRLNQRNSSGPGAARDMKRLADELSENPSGWILVSLVDPTRVHAPLNHAMPGASTEDYVWYYLHLALLRAQAIEWHIVPFGITEPCHPDVEAQQVLVQSLQNLQNQIERIGYSDLKSSDHSGNNAMIDLNICKYFLFSLHITRAIYWLIERLPSLNKICLHWLLYANQHGLIGLSDSSDHSKPAGVLTRTVEIRLDESQNELSPTVASIGALVGDWLDGSDVKRVFIEYLLPLNRHDRLRALERAIIRKPESFCHSEILGSSQDQRDNVGLSTIFDEVTFTKIVEFLSSACVELGKHLEAAKCLFVIKKFSDCLRTIQLGILESCKSGSNHDELLKFIEILSKNRTSNLHEHQKLWKDVMLGQKMVEAFVLLKAEKYEDVVSMMENYDLVMTGKTLSSWLNGPYRQVASKLLECYVVSFYRLGQSGLLSASTEKEKHMMQNQCIILLEAFGRLTDEPERPSHECGIMIREVLTWVESLSKSARGRPDLY
eukprot:GHVP01036553.1.p1 GENE.GHVP01036553.1~~GHVP01036553.1.p1  ORF type:complete len:1043 (+),score=161.85 GHVP01036553.1:18-3146(+)